MKSIGRILVMVADKREEFWVKSNPVPLKLNHVCKCSFITLRPSYASLLSLNTLFGAQSFLELEKLNGI